jgi:hypothetical protein
MSPRKFERRTASTCAARHSAARQVPRAAPTFVDEHVRVGRGRFVCRWCALFVGLVATAFRTQLSSKFEGLEKSREDAESRADSYVRLARAIYVISPAEARVYFDRAVEIASRIGDENLSRWTALLYLASASGVRDDPRARTAYRFSRAAELTYEYVARDKHFDWEGSRTTRIVRCRFVSSSATELSRGMTPQT